MMKINKDSLTSEINIRSFSGKEIEPCARLYADIFGKPPWNEHWSFIAAQSKLKKIFSKKTFIGFTAEYNDTTAGCLLGYLMSTVHPFNRVYYVNELFVRTEYQNRKIGKKLVDMLIRDLRSKKIQWIVLITKKDTNAERFYKSIGFKRSLAGSGPAKRIMMSYRLKRQEMEEDE